MHTIDNLFRPLARIDQPELIDQPGVAPHLLAENLADLRAINRWLGGTWLTLHALERLLAGLPLGSEFTALDLATGSADIPRAVLAWAARRGWRARLIATDLSPSIVRLAAADAPPGLSLAIADACALPLPDRSVDVALCSLALHHLPPVGAVAALREMRRVARCGLLVNDIVRWRPGYWGARLVGTLISRNPLTRHDGPASVLRAYTVAELAELAAAAGLESVRFMRVLGYRVVMLAS